MNAKITDLNSRNVNDSNRNPISKSDAAKLSDFVSGSDQYQTTLVNRYKVLSSAGSFNKDLVNKTPSGYVVYSSVQGTLVSRKEGY